MYISRESWGNALMLQCFPSCPMSPEPLIWLPINVLLSGFTSCLRQLLFLLSPEESSLPHLDFSGGREQVLTLNTTSLIGDEVWENYNIKNLKLPSECKAPIPPQGHPWVPLFLASSWPQYNLFISPQWRDSSECPFPGSLERGNSFPSFQAKVYSLNFLPGNLF